MTKKPDTYAVRLLKVGRHKIDVIRVIRAVTGVGLPAAKEFLEQAPCVLQEGVTKLDADSLVSQLDAVGAEASVEGGKPLTNENLADISAGVDSFLKEEARMKSRHDTRWQCVICGLLTDLEQCPIDGNLSP